MVVEVLDPVVEQLRTARQQQSLSQREVAGRIGRVSHQSVWAWEAGCHDPALGTVRQWAAALGYDLILVAKTAPPVVTP
jgi:transcriptional regulator with XRE-family HTH domain